MEVRAMNEVAERSVEALRSTFSAIESETARLNSLGASKAQLEAQVTGLQKNVAEAVARLEQAQRSAAIAEARRRDVDAEADRITSSAQAEASRIVADGQRQAREIIAAARARVAAAAVASGEVDAS